MNFIKKFVLILIPFSFLNILQLDAALVDKKNTENLIELILDGASRTIGEKVDAKEVEWDWCEGTYYDSRQSLICLEKKFISELLKVGDAAVAFVVAHEYAHHVQYAQKNLILRAKNNT